MKFPTVQWNFIDILCLVNICDIHASVQPSCGITNYAELIFFTPINCSMIACIVKDNCIDAESSLWNPTHLEGQNQGLSQRYL